MTRARPDAGNDVRAAQSDQKDVADRPLLVVMLTQDTLKEQRLLKTSIVVTIVVSVASISFGLFIGSKSIAFDGFYTLIDAAMTLVALLTVRLIAKGDDDRFQYGYWHLEPILALVNGTVLTFACAYAFIDGLNGLLSGGRAIEFGPGAIFAAVAGLISLAMFGYIRWSAGARASQLLNLDARAWLMGGILSLALCVSFALGSTIAVGRFAAYAPLVDPLILIVVAAVLLPFPLATIWRAGQDILQIAPSDLDRDVREIAQSVAEAHGFSDFSSHVMRSGRQQFIEIGLVAPSDQTSTSFGDLDAIRREIAQAMGGLSPGYWLTVDFTADKRWV
ncbi:MAG: Cation diffusion facilitator family transporter [Tardiphaga sp.]|nr:Cation diffusion facilitator family transporter [Tardiphaga sp.]